jgi:hypothetical protein
VSRAAPRSRPKLGGNRGAKVDKLNVTATGTFSNSDPVRQLIHCKDGVLLYELKRGASTSFEVVAPNGDCWCYKLLYSAESKWSRLVGKAGGQNEERKQQERAETYKPRCSVSVIERGCGFAEAVPRLSIGDNFSIG